MPWIIHLSFLLFIECPNFSFIGHNKNFLGSVYVPRWHSLWKAPCNLSCLSWRQDDQSLYNCEKFFRSFCFCHIFFSMTCKMVFMSTLFSVKTGQEKLWYFNHLLGHFLILRLVFCFEICSKLPWEKIFWWLRKTFLSSNLANFLRSLEQLIRTVRGILTYVLKNFEILFHLLLEISQI